MKISCFKYFYCFFIVVGFFKIEILFCTMMILGFLMFHLLQGGFRCWITQTLDRIWKRIGIIQIWNISESINTNILIFLWYESSTQTNNFMFTKGRYNAYNFKFLCTKTQSLKIPRHHSCNECSCQCTELLVVKVNIGIGN